jgi:hypothetical protein
MSKPKRSVPEYTNLKWAKLKERNGYILTADEKKLLGQPGGR